MQTCAFPQVWAPQSSLYALHWHKGALASEEMWPRHYKQALGPECQAYLPCEPGHGGTTASTGRVVVRVTVTRGTPSTNEHTEGQMLCDSILGASKVHEGGYLAHSQLCPQEHRQHPAHGGHSGNIWHM